MLALSEIQKVEGAVQVVVGAASQTSQLVCFVEIFCSGPKRKLWNVISVALEVEWGALLPFSWHLLLMC